MNKRNLLEPRLAFMPFEYPEFENFAHAVEFTFWVHDELDFERDIQDFKVKLTDTERYIIGTILKTFAQTEVFVADEFWSRLPDYIKKPEAQMVFAKFTENEWRHAEAYARLNVKMGLDNFSEFLTDGVALARFENLTKIREDHKGNPSIKDLARTLAVFGGFTENVNLMSQFAILRSFSSNGRNLLTDIGDIIDWSQKDESAHAQFAMHLYNILREENEEYFIENEIADDIYEGAEITYQIELSLLDQIFEQGELPNLTKAELINFMKDRINQSLVIMKLEPRYDVDQELLSRMSWFTNQMIGLEDADFFSKRPTAYTKYMSTIRHSTVHVKKEEVEEIKMV